MSTIVLKTNVTDGTYTFLTQNNGKDTVKSPEGMFPSYAIDNDLWYVDQKIRNYYELGEFISDEDLKEIDEAVKHDDIPIKDEKKSRRGRRAKETSEEAENESKPEETAANEETPLPTRKRRDTSEETPAPSEKPVRRRRRTTVDDIDVPFTFSDEDNN